MRPHHRKPKPTLRRLHQPFRDRKRRSAILVSRRLPLQRRIDRFWTFGGVELQVPEEEVLVGVFLLLSGGRFRGGFAEEVGLQVVHADEFFDAGLAVAHGVVGVVVGGGYGEVLDAASDLR